MYVAAHKNVNIVGAAFLLKYKWKNHFHEMNGDVGMAGYKV